MKITPAQCRAGRALLAWSREKLVLESHVGWGTLSSFELGKSKPWPKTLHRIEQTLAARGIEFLGDENAPGVRLRPIAMAAA